MMISADPATVVADGPAAVLAAEEVTWARVEDDFYVGNYAGVFLGYIEKRRGTSTFAVFSGEAVLIGERTTLRAAMTALSEHATSRNLHIAS